MGRFGLKIAMSSNFYDIWHLVQIKHANYEYGTWNWWSWLKIKIWANFAPIFMKFGTRNKWNMLIMNILLAMV